MTIDMSIKFLKLPLKTFIDFSLNTMICLQTAILPNWYKALFYQIGTKSTYVKVDLKSVCKPYDFLPKKANTSAQDMHANCYSYRRRRRPMHRQALKQDNMNADAWLVELGAF